MDFFGIGILEILLVLIVALAIWGPARMVEIARKLGKLMHTLRQATAELKDTVTKEIDAGEDNTPLRRRPSTKAGGVRKLKTPPK